MRKSVRRLRPFGQTAAAQAATSRFIRSSGHASSQSMVASPSRSPSLPPSGPLRPFHHSARASIPGGAAAASDRSAVSSGRRASPPCRSRPRSHQYLPCHRCPSPDRPRQRPAARTRTASLRTRRTEASTKKRRFVIKTPPRLRYSVAPSGEPVSATSSPSMRTMVFAQARPTCPSSSIANARRRLDPPPAPTDVNIDQSAPRDHARFLGRPFDGHRVGPPAHTSMG